MMYKDQLNQNIQLKDSPKRIVSLVPSQTELLIDLGLQNSIVGITKFCIHPAYLRKEKCIVGGTKHVDYKKIKALQPDIILCNKEENTKAIITALESIAPVHISDIYNLDNCYELIKMYGDIFKVKKEAATIISNIEKERKQYKNKIKSLSKPKVAYFIWKTPWMVAASDTFINYMLNEAGYDNVFENKNRYPEIHLDNPQLKQLDIIFLSSEPYPFKSKHILELKSQFPDKDIKIVDGELFSWYGSRLKKSYSYFEQLYTTI